LNPQTLVQLSGRRIRLLLNQLTQLIQINLDHRRSAPWPGASLPMLASPLHHATNP